MFALETRNIFSPAETVIGTSFFHGFRNESKPKLSIILSSFMTGAGVCKAKIHLQLTSKDSMMSNNAV